MAAIWSDLLGTRPVPGDRFFEAGGDSLIVLRFVSHARDAGIHLDPADVYAYPEFSELDRLCQERRHHAGKATPGHAQDRLLLGPAQQWLLAMNPASMRAWTQSHIVAFDHIPSRGRLSRALCDVLSSTPVLRTYLSPSLDALIVRPAEPVRIDITDAASSEAELRQVISALGQAIDPGAGVMVCAAVINGDGDAGALVLVAHHLVVDTWSWPIIEDRIRLSLSGRLIRPDHGFAQFTESVARQVSGGAFDLDAGLWRQLLAAGGTAALADRPTAAMRAERVIAAPGELARRWLAPASRILLAALGDGLHAAYGDGTTVIDLERNGRGSVADLDLSRAAGWIALHHPLMLPHQPLSLDAIEHVRQGTEEIPDFGLGYGALRWSGRRDLGDQIARFAVNIDTLTAPHHPENPVARRARSLTAAPGTSRDLPYHGTFTFLRGPNGTAVRLDYDPARVSPDQAGAILDAATSATRRCHPGQARRRSEGTSSPLAGQPIPASAMQRLMLHYASSVPGAYLPRQVLAIHGIGDHDLFLDEISTLLGGLAPFRHRFHADDTGTFVTWLPGSAAVPVTRAAGGRQAALSWIDSPDRITTASLLGGEPSFGLTAFAEGTSLLLGMETHHALLDGVSNTQLLALIGQFAHRLPAGLRGVAEYRQQASLVATRKHVACELAAGEEMKAPRHAAPLATRLPTRSSIVIPADRIRRVREWASRHGTDLRAALAAAATVAAADVTTARTMYIVANGRDPDIPGAADALGMFWYFQQVAITTSRPTVLAKAVYRAAAAPLSDTRSAAQRWPQWDTEGMAFNFIKQEPATRDGPQTIVIASRDTFHFATQVEACLRPDGSVLVDVTATRDEASPEKLASRVGELISQLASGRGR